jgi:hypothetical protein
MRFLFLIFVFLIGCSSEKQIQRAKNRLSANPLEAASFCASSFPNKETIIYRDSVTLDTIFLELTRTDTIVDSDTVRIITTSPAQVITKTLTKYKEVQIENTAKVEQQRQLLIRCEGRYDALQKKFEKSEEQRKAWRKRFYWIIFVILGFAVGYVLKQPTLSGILKKTIKQLKKRG